MVLTRVGSNSDSDDGGQDDNGNDDGIATLISFKNGSIKGGKGAETVVGYSFILNVSSSLPVAKRYDLR